jgi:predicted metal-dependent phosphoesterase TrpH
VRLHQQATSDGFLLPEDQITLGRPHFADWLCRQSFAKDRSHAFRAYLSHSQLGDVKTFWPSMSQAVAWIRSIQGSAVLAHPARYKLTATKRRALVKAFKQAGGHALEVVSGQQSLAEKEVLVQLCQDFQLTASRASDFHTPDNPWVELGNMADLPTALTPVWHDWSLPDLS